MATFKTFEEIEAWQEARELTRLIYEASNKTPFSRDFVLRDQARRAAISVVANIAEGFERSGTGEFVQFLAHAKGSAGELRAHIYLARDQEYLSENAFKDLLERASRVSRLVSGLMSYLRRSGIKGTKFKTVNLKPET